ncbi:MAG: hypothetical protein ACYDH3_08220 [Candidatus Aminicenantales bacterium]
MQDLLAQAPPSAIHEGLPYWIFYFLFSLIVLLLLFIFLRDKDLRRRLSVGLAGAKRGVQRKRLHVRLNREKRRKIYLFREIGRTIWGGRIAPETFGAAFERLERLEAEIAARHAALQSFNDGILAAGTELEETRKKRRALLKQKESGGEIGAADIRAAKDAERAIKRRGGDLERKSKAERAGLRQSGGQKASEYERLGVQADGLRIEHLDLREFYDRIDKVNRDILTALDKIEKLG